MAVEQLEAQKEVILGLEDVNKHLENIQDMLCTELQEAQWQIAYLMAWVVVPPPEALTDSSDSNNDDDEDDGLDQGQDWMDEGSAPELDSIDLDQQLPITGSGAQF